MRNVDLHWKISAGSEPAWAGLRVDQELIYVDHVVVPEAHRGQGIAGELAQAVVDMAKGGGKKIVPNCPYMRAYIERKKLEELVA